MPTSKDKNTPNIFFRFYFNDFRNKTGHLSCLERGVYLNAMLAYYTSGKPLPQEQSRLFRLVDARSDEEKAALLPILEEFFTKEDGIWRHKRCDEELLAIIKRRDNTKKATEARWPEDEPTECAPDSVTDYATEDDPSRNAPRIPSRSPSSSSSSSSKQDQKQKQDQKHPTNLPSIKENDNSENGRSDRQDAVCQKAFTSSKSNSQEWIKFVAGLRDQDADVQNWVLYGETETKVRAAVEQYGAEGLFLALGDWKEARRPPVSGLDYPWQVFLREAENNLKEWAEAVKKYPHVYNKAEVKQ